MFEKLNEKSTFGLLRRLKTFLFGLGNVFGGIDDRMVGDRVVLGSRNIC